MVGARIREQGQLQAVDFRQAAARNALQVAVQAGRRFDEAAKLLFELGPKHRQYSSAHAASQVLSQFVIERANWVLVRVAGTASRHAEPRGRYV
jgi:hypothetical protein